MMQIEVEISNHHHILPPSLHLNSSTYYGTICTLSISLLLSMGGMSSGANLVVVVRKSRLCKKPLINKSLHQSKVGGSGSGDYLGELSVDRDRLAQPNLIHLLLLLCLYLISLLQTEPSLCLPPLLFPHTTDNGRLLSIHRLMETRQ